MARTIPASEPPPAPSRREALRDLGLGLAAGALVGCLPRKIPAAPPLPERFVYLVDPARCIGCTRCAEACAEENDLPPGARRTVVLRHDRPAEGDPVAVRHRAEAPFDFPLPAPGHRAEGFTPMLCQHCEDPPCVPVCPVGASYQSPTGLALVDAERCIGCGYCVQACPYGARSLRPDTHVADKCTLCHHRLARGLAPACVDACPTGARTFGDPARDERLAALLAERHFVALRPEAGTRPRLRYRVPGSRGGAT